MKISQFQCPRIVPGAIFGEFTYFSRQKIYILRAFFTFYVLITVRYSNSSNDVCFCLVLSDDDAAVCPYLGGSGARPHIFLALLACCRLSAFVTFGSMPLCVVRRPFFTFQSPTTFFLWILLGECEWRWRVNCRDENLLCARVFDFSCFRCRIRIGFLDFRLFSRSGWFFFPPPFLGNVSISKI